MLDLNGELLLEDVIAFTNDKYAILKLNCHFMIKICL